MEWFYQGKKITMWNRNAYKKITSCICQGMFGKTPVSDISVDFQKNVLW